VAIIKQLCAEISSPSPDGGFTVDAERAAILKNMGLHVTVGKIITVVAPTVESLAQPWVEEVVTPAYTFLQMMSQNNAELACELVPLVPSFVRHLAFSSTFQGRRCAHSHDARQR